MSKVSETPYHSNWVLLPTLPEGVTLQDDDVDDMLSISKDISPIVDKHFPTDSPQNIFWKQQIDFNSLKEKKQMKWHPFTLRFALNLKYLSTSAYRALNKSGIIHLPSERTLRDYTHWTKPHSGVSIEFIEELKHFT